ncbi:MAG: putative GNAT family N-acyltransferase [Planctomycetota bacterium]|jgi:predicted GNAT family N-acyltransferase
MSARITKGARELQRCLEIRCEVYVEEQRVPLALELDGMESRCTHFIAWADEAGAGPTGELDAAVGTARLMINSSREALAQRVAVLAAARGRGIGRMLMLAIEQEVKTRGLSRISLGAQLTAIGFYETLGYEAFGEEFDDAGIPHRMMRHELP